MIRKYHNHKLQTNPWHREVSAPNSVEPDKMLLKCDITSGSFLFAKVLMEIPVLSPPMHILELLYHSIIDLFSMLSSESKRIRQRRTLLHVPLLKIICILTTHPPIPLDGDSATLMAIYDFL